MGDWHRREIADVVRELRTDPGTGLTGAEAAAGIRAGGPNDLPEGPSLRPGRIFLSQFASTMVAVLLGAAVVSALLGDVVDTVAIGALLGILCLAVALPLHRAEDPSWRTALFTTLTFAQMAHVLAIRSRRETLLRPCPLTHKTLLLAPA